MQGSVQVLGNGIILENLPLFVTKVNFLGNFQATVYKDGGQCKRYGFLPFR